MARLNIDQLLADAPPAPKVKKSKSKKPKGKQRDLRIEALEHIAVQVAVTLMRKLAKSMKKGQRCPTPIQMSLAIGEAFMIGATGQLIEVRVR